MGTWFDLHVEGPDPAGDLAALVGARAEVERLEQVFSRFRESSQLSELNRRRGGPLGADMRRVVDLALRMRTLTGGWFDPTVGEAVRAAGYDRPFEQIGTGRTVTAAATARGTSRATVIVDPGGAIALPAGVSLDLGAIAKGYAADVVCALLAARGPSLVSAGGDIAAAGPRGEGPWPVAIGTPDGRVVALLEHGALATSGVDRRRWTSGAGDERHHVIDPRSARCADTDLLRVTVAADRCAVADALATALLASGAESARAMCSDLDLSAVLVQRGGDTIRTGSL
ncbi:MAG: FAD:protein FMN transferase [Thermoleophilia bacterium]|nr:FAD:protein FMN transferase [Thermoleophilia bacterium]